MGRETPQKPPAEAPMPTDPMPSPASPEDPQVTDPSPDPAPAEYPGPSGLPEEPEVNPFNDAQSG